MKRPVFFLGVFFLGICAAAQAHDIITTPITFNREISRIIYARCASCHHKGGRAFSLMTYAEARPWAVAIKEEVLEDRMPPWGAVKGFGDFRNETALTPEQVELIVNWTEGGAPEGDAKDLPPPPKSFSGQPAVPANGIEVKADFKLARSIVLDGIVPQTVPENASAKITATLPDGSEVPLLWLENYKKKFAHPFLLREPMKLPAGTVISGLPAGASIILLPAAP